MIMTAVLQAAVTLWTSCFSWSWAQVWYLRPYLRTQKRKCWESSIVWCILLRQDFRATVWQIIFWWWEVLISSLTFISYCCLLAHSTLSRLASLLSFKHDTCAPLSAPVCFPEMLYSKISTCVTSCPSSGHYLEATFSVPSLTVLY